MPRRCSVVDRGAAFFYFTPCALQKLLVAIKTKFDAGRAVLVVFRDQARMNAFALDLQSRKIENPHWKPPLQLSDMLSESERESVVIKAARPYAVTLMTRAYGRGTDFACRDSALVKNGGVHVILTFVPDDRSEEKQICGRTCRQDNPGSIEKVLFEDDLSYIGASEREFRTGAPSSSAPGGMPGVLSAAARRATPPSESMEAYLEAKRAAHEASRRRAVRFSSGRLE